MNERSGKPLPRAGPPVVHSEPERRAAISNLKERVYATFTGLAISLLLRIDANELSLRQAIISLGAGVVAICTAGYISDVVAHSTVTGALADRAERRTMLQTAGGGIATLAVPLLILVGGLPGWYTLRQALNAIILVYLLTLGVIVLLAVRRTPLSWAGRILALLAILALGGLFILLELVADFGSSQ